MHTSADVNPRQALPLRLILPVAVDLSEMIDLLHAKKENALRSLDMEGARGVQSEISELKEQLDKEERHPLEKRMEKTKLRAEAKRAVTIGEGGAKNESSNCADSLITISVSAAKPKESDLGTSIGCGITSLLCV